MTDVTVAPQGSALPAVPTEVEINQNPTTSPTPVGSQAPDKPVENRAQARRASVEAAFDRAANPDKVERRPKAPPAEATISGSVHSRIGSRAGSPARRTVQLRKRRDNLHRCPSTRPTASRRHASARGRASTGRQRLRPCGATSTACTRSSTGPTGATAPTTRP